jgi:PIN domain nuclease of toxin-antitoxin system
LLLDTHTFLWWRLSPKRIRRDTHEQIAVAEAVFVSIASAWEAAIKIGLGQIKLPEPFALGVERSGFQPLAISFAHAERVATLPQIHRDPFDRMLIAQAEIERLTLVTGDAAILAYGVAVLEA